MSERNYIERLRTDLQRPAGGWTFGLVTILLAIVTPGFVWLAGLPQWIGTVLMVAFLFIHMMWGAAGYYPRGF
jgi:hypothetical protein